MAQDLIAMGCACCPLPCPVDVGSSYSQLVCVSLHAQLGRPVCAPGSRQSVQNNCVASNPVIDAFVYQ